MTLAGTAGTESAPSKVIAFCKSAFGMARSASSPTLPTSGAESGEHHSPTPGTGTSLPSATPSEPLRDEAGRFISENRRKVIATAEAMRAQFPDRQWRHEL
jgi:hypothetical protein